MTIYKTLITVFVITCVSVAAASISAADDIEEPRSCVQCNMDRKAHADSRMLIQYEDGLSAGVCSVRCAAKALKMHPERPVKSIQVADMNTGSLIDAKQAFWVMGGSKPGVMTGTPKWAFGTRAAAEAFMKEKGGSPAEWDDVLKAANREMHEKMHMKH